LCKKAIKWDFNEECKIVYNTLKARLVAYPIMRQPDFTKQFILYSDASGLAMGAILAQIGDDNKEFVIAYASKLFKKAETFRYKNLQTIHIRHQIQSFNRSFSSEMTHDRRGTKWSFSK
jgi:hypothetical protein